MLPIPGRDGNEGGTSHSPKLQRYCDLTIRLLSIIYRALVAVGGSYSPVQKAVGVFYSPSRLGNTTLVFLSVFKNLTSPSSGRN